MSCKVYPPWGEPMRDPGLNLLAHSCRIVYGIIGPYLAARFAPRHPMPPALVLGAIGTVLSLAGAIAAIRMDLWVSMNAAGCRTVHRRPPPRWAPSTSRLACANGLSLGSDGLTDV